jgi:hypothetical protein
MSLFMIHAFAVIMGGAPAQRLRHGQRQSPRLGDAARRRDRPVLLGSVVITRRLWILCVLEGTAAVIASEAKQSIPQR